MHERPHTRTGSLHTSTITYTYDAGDRVTQIVDSANGTIARAYDDFDRLTEETTAEGTVEYTYDADGRRATMVVAGQPAVSYTYDAAHRLTQIAQDTAVVSVTYDDADRRRTLTYPNGIVATYGYDAANQLTSLSYALGQTTLGDLTYTYDAAGRRTNVGGSWARTGIPAAMSGATYDAANRICHVERHVIQLRPKWESRLRRRYQLYVECAESACGVERRGVRKLRVRRDGPAAEQDDRRDDDEFRLRWAELRPGASEWRDADRESAHGPRDRRDVHAK